jgi:hypothetical protein
MKKNLGPVTCGGAGGSARNAGHFLQPRRWAYQLPYVTDSLSVSRTKLGKYLTNKVSYE